MCWAAGADMETFGLGLKPWASTKLGVTGQTWSVSQTLWTRDRNGNQKEGESKLEILLKYS